jgi:hypothetical protein
MRNPIMKIGRNDPCHCGSGKKFKKCHGSSAEASVVAEVSKIGAQWVQRHVRQLLDLAGYQTDIDSDLSTQMIHILDEKSQGSFTDVMLESKSKKEKEIFQSLHLSVGLSIIEPLEVLEVKRGYNLKVRGCFTHKVSTIEQIEDAAELEPMEWILGRVIVFAKKSYLLPDWKKIPFRQRKNLRRLIEAHVQTHPVSSAEDVVKDADTTPSQGNSVSEESESNGEVTEKSAEKVTVNKAWFKQNAMWILNQYQEVSTS